MISKKEEQIYNSHLYTSRSVKNKPTKFRSNFDNLAEKDEVCLKKLSSFFNRYSNINYNSWFIAPYKVYNDSENYFDLHFYTTRKALKCYTMYMKQQETADPDGDDSIVRMKECLAFVYNYCKDNNLTLDEYTNEIRGSLPTVLNHLKEHKISFYMLHLLDVDVIIKSIETSILNFIVSDFWNTFSQTRIKFAGSNLLKTKARKGKQIIENKLKTKNNKL